MLTDEDVKKLIEVFATREEATTKQDFEELRKDFARLATGVDTYAKKADTYFQEMVMLSHKVDRHEKWLQQIAGKMGRSTYYSSAQYCFDGQEKEEEKITSLMSAPLLRGALSLALRNL